MSMNKFNRLVWEQKNKYLQQRKNN